MAKVPAHVAQGRRSPFPAGTFLGKLGKVTDNWNQDKTVMSIMVPLSTITPFDEESPQVGNRTKTQRITVIHYDQAKKQQTALVDVQEFTDDVPFMLQQSAGLLTQLAIAFGAVSGTDSDGNVDVDLESFLEDLLANTYVDREVVFTIRHRTYARRDDLPGKKTGIGDDIAQFQSPEAVAGEDEAVEVTAPAPTAVPAPRLSGLRGRK